MRGYASNAKSRERLLANHVADESSPGLVIVAPRLVRDSNREPLIPIGVGRADSRVHAGQPLLMCESTHAGQVEHSVIHHSEHLVQARHTESRDTAAPLLGAGGLCANTLPSPGATGSVARAMSPTNSTDTKADNNVLWTALTPPPPQPTSECPPKRKGGHSPVGCYELFTSAGSGFPVGSTAASGHGCTPPALCSSVALAAPGMPSRPNTGHRSPGDTLGPPAATGLNLDLPRDFGRWRLRGSGCRIEVR